MGEGRAEEDERVEERERQRTGLEAPCAVRPWHCFHIRG